MGGRVPREMQPGDAGRSVAFMVRRQPVQGRGVRGTGRFKERGKGRTGTGDGIRPTPSTSKRVPRGEGKVLLGRLEAWYQENAG